MHAAAETFVVSLYSLDAFFKTFLDSIRISQNFVRNTRLPKSTVE